MDQSMILVGVRDNETGLALALGPLNRMYVMKPMPDQPVETWLHPYIFESRRYVCEVYQPNSYEPLFRVTRDGSRLCQESLTGARYRVSDDGLVLISIDEDESPVREVRAGIDLCFLAAFHAAVKHAVTVPTT